MKKHILFLFMVCLLPWFVFAEGIPANRIIELGTNAFQQRSHQTASAKSVDFLTEGTDTLVAVLHFENGGFIIMATDDAFWPVIGYSVDGDFPLDNVAPAAMYWVNGYKEMIARTRQQHLAATDEITRQWQALDEKNTRNQRSVVVEPLIKATWNQSQYYNDLCPADDASPYGYGGHVPCGCVALAMAMVIHYYRYPATAQGQHGYYSTYGYLSVNFSQQSYNYNAMPYAVVKKNNEVARLISHCGIAVDMGYDPEGSGAQTEDTRTALVNYYKYSSDAQAENRSGGWGGGGSTTAQWISKLQGDLNSGMPIIYSGYSSEGGHAFLCDGYDSDDLFHFNFGWGGTGNGYFTVQSNDDNAVGGFTQWQQIVHNIHPPASSYPSYCQNITVNASAGSLEDGSGPNDYQNNANCTYVIQPENGKSVTLNVVDLDLEEGHDFLKIYDGNPNNGGTLVASYTGNTFNPQTSHYMTTPAAYLVFTSDAAGTAGGWKVSFATRRYVTCTSTTTYRDATGTFTDGSGDETYAADASCSWNITPTNATYVMLHFNSIDISSEDYVQVYDGTDMSTANLLGEFTGNNIPNNLVSTTGKMKVHFKSDNYLERSGFMATWTSDGHEGDPDNPEVSISDANDVPFDLYPNPANSQLRFTIPGDFANGVIRIVDLNGKVVKMLNVAEIYSNAQVSVSDLSAGIYLVTISNNKEVLSKKLIINR